MLARLFDLDRWILARVQRFCHWTQRTFGVSATMWARGFAALGMALSLCSWTPFNALLIAPKTIEIFRKDRSGTDAIEWNASAACLRLWGALWIPPLLTVGLLTGTPPWFAFIAIADIFHACTDLPPGKSKVRQWLESATRVLRPVTEAGC